MKVLEGLIANRWPTKHRVADRLEELTMTDGALELHTSRFWFFRGEKDGWKDMDIGPLTTKKNGVVYLAEEALSGYEGPATLTIALMALPGTMTPPCEEKFYRGTFSGMKFVSDCGYVVEFAIDDHDMVAPKEKEEHQ